MDVRSREQSDLVDIEDYAISTNIGSEAGFGQDESFGSHQTQSNLIRQYGGISVSNVGEGPGVDKNGRSLQRLHQRRVDGVFHEHHKGSTGSLSRPPRKNRLRSTLGYGEIDLTKSSAVTGLPCLLEATTIFPRRVLKSA